MNPSSFCGVDRVDLTKTNPPHKLGPIDQATTNVNVVLDSTRFVDSGTEVPILIDVEDGMKKTVVLLYPPAGEIISKSDKSSKSTPRAHVLWYIN